MCVYIYIKQQTLRCITVKCKFSPLQNSLKRNSIYFRNIKNRKGNKQTNKQTNKTKQKQTKKEE